MKSGEKKVIVTAVYFADIEEMTFEATMDEVDDLISQWKCGEKVLAVPGAAMAFSAEGLVGISSVECETPLYLRPRALGVEITQEALEEDPVVTPGIMGGYPQDEE